jgi:hypothetical protein
MLTGMTVLTLDSWVILVYEVTLDELDGQTRLSYTATADYHELVLSEELERESAGPRRYMARVLTFDAILYAVYRSV